MLDRQKLIKAFNQIIPKQIISKEEQLQIAQDLLGKLLFLPKNDSIFANIFQENFTSHNLPKLLEPFDIYTINQINYNKYSAIGIDGSQIYPDKHEGFNYGLINISIVKIDYDQKSSVKFDTLPTLISHAVVGESLSVDLINCQRTQYEFEAGFNQIQDLSESSINNFKEIVLFDGSLIFWHLQSKDEQIKNYFLGKYLEIFENIFKKKSLHASYISLPQSKDIINILRAAQVKLNFKQDVLFDTIVDGEVLFPFLTYGKRTSIFMIDSSTSKFYPEYLCPCFIYINVGSEIARVEFPLWIAKIPEEVNTICSLILEQCAKGLGYPVTLSLAHEQAVITSSDRNFFYQTLNKLFLANSSTEKKYSSRFINSFKSIKLSKKYKSII